MGGVGIVAVRGAVAPGLGARVRLLHEAGGGERGDGGVTAVQGRFEHLMFGGLYFVEGVCVLRRGGFLLA